MNTTFISRGLNFSIAHGNPFQPRKNVADGYNALTILLLRHTFMCVHILLMQLHKLLCWTMLQAVSNNYYKTM